MRKVAVWSRTPLRLGLAGGGTDLSEFSLLEGGRVVNATINRFVHVRISESESNETLFKSYDTGESSKLFDSESHGNMPIFRESLARILQLAKIDGHPPIVIESFSDSPVGSGLGTSSALCVGILNALAKWFKIELDRHELAELAYLVEREDCGFSGGMQDQFAASYGGINDMVFQTNGEVEVREIAVKSSFVKILESSIVLFFSGKSRNSSMIIDGQKRNIGETNSDAYKALLQMKKNTNKLLESLEKSNLNDFANSLRMGWEEKKKTSSSVSSESLDSIINSSYQKGSIGAKISGAGGGGFLLLVVPFENRNRVVSWLRALDGVVMTCNFTREGSIAWFQ